MSPSAEPAEPSARQTGVSSARGARVALRVARPASALYDACVDLVQARFLRAHGAVVDPRPDLFVVLVATGAGPTAVWGTAGLTGAGTRAPLSERYLDRPVEQVCSWVDDRTSADRPVDRATVCEMGSVASARSGSAALVLRAVPGIACGLGYSHVVATLTSGLHDVARTVSWDFRAVTTSRRGELPPDQRERWGTYYDTRPRTGVLRCADHTPWRGTSDEVAGTIMAPGAMGDDVRRGAVA